MDIKEIYDIWVEKAVECDAAELAAMADDPKAMEDAFCQELQFGTAGLRGILGAGSNRMNVYTVGKATQGLADYLVANYDEPSIAIARDSRNMGNEFVRRVAGIMAANGVRAYVYPRVMPTPALSFAVRDLKTSAGINVTASHNPAAYNGYKVYGPDGCQITTQAAKDISAAIAGVDPFDDVKYMTPEQASEEGLFIWITEGTCERFLDAVEEQAFAVDATLKTEEPEMDPMVDMAFAAPGDPEGVAKMAVDPASTPKGQRPEDEAGDFSIVYTPLNGTGLECVTSILERIGVNAITLVQEQAHPDGNFPTCPYPNPEAREALELGVKTCEEVHADLLLATDPDADRVGIAVPHNGEYVLLSGNEVGVLLTDFVCEMRKARGEDLSRGVAITTIVSSTMVDALSQEHGFELRRTLTGFKWIGEQIAMLEADGEADRFIFGFEESYGYLAGTHVRDKDAVVASMLIVQMAYWHKAQGRDLVDAMEALYAKHGYYLNRTVSLSYPGVEGAAKMKDLTASLRANPLTEVAGLTVEGWTDFAPGAPMPVMGGRGDAPEQSLPGADVLEFRLSGGNKLLIRPSGTEPKIKAYVFAKGETRAQAQELLDAIEAAARQILS